MTLGPAPARELGLDDHLYTLQVLRQRFPVRLMRLIRRAHGRSAFIGLDLGDRRLDVLQFQLVLTGVDLLRPGPKEYFLKGSP